MNSDWDERSDVTTARGYNYFLCNWAQSLNVVVQYRFFNKKITVNGPYKMSLF